MQSDEHEMPDTCSISTATDCEFRANKNGNGQILGTVLQCGHNTIVDPLLGSFKGNKNKTGQTLGQSTCKIALMFPYKGLTYKPTRLPYACRLYIHGQ